MGWGGEGLADIRCPKCGARMNLLSGAWSECPPDAFKLSCPKCDYYEDMDYDKGYDMMMKMTDDFYRKAKKKEREAKYRESRIKHLKDLKKKTWGQEVELEQLMEEAEKEG